MVNYDSEELHALLWYFLIIFVEMVNGNKLSVEQYSSIAVTAASSNILAQCS